MPTVNVLPLHFPSVIAHVHLAQISTPATGPTKIGRLAACANASEKNGEKKRRECGMKNWNEKLALSVSKYDVSLSI